MKRQILGISMLFLTSQNVLAGWTSGGGELHDDHSNPWFVQNTTEATYCVTIDEANFGQTRGVATRLIEKGIAYWKDEFARNPYQTEQGLKIATQNFHEVACDQNPDIAFQFGILNDEQKDKLDVANHQHVGIAVRTSYDEVNLRGKGFVYIAPARGPLALNGSGIRENPWLSEMPLSLVLTHELGHIFGLRHSPFSEHGLEIMSANLAENAVKDYPLDIFKILTPSLPYFFQPKFPAESIVCSSVDSKSKSNILNKNRIFELFDMPHEMCIKINVTPTGLTLDSSDRADGPWTVRVVGRFREKSPAKMTAGPDSTGMLVLTKNQKVFSTFPTNGVMAFGWQTHIKTGVTIKAVDNGVERNFNFEYNPLDITLSGFDEDGNFQTFLGFPASGTHRFPCESTNLTHNPRKNLKTHLIDP